MKTRGMHRGRTRADAVHARPRRAGSDRVPVIRRTHVEEEPSACVRCGAVFLRKTWREGARARRARYETTGWTVCPACVQQMEGEYFGRVRLIGPIDGEQAEALVRRIRNVERRAQYTQPERRTVHVERTREGLEVLTTSQKLAHRIGRELEKAFGGRCRFHWTGPEGTLDAVWNPPARWKSG